jgi:hypothetical protein
MADNVEEKKAADGGSPGEEPDMTPDQSFTYWLIMMPFLITAGVFVYKFAHTPGEYKDMINAVGAVVVGLFIATAVQILMQGSGEKPEENGNSAETPKEEGTR